MLNLNQVAYGHAITSAAHAMRQQQAYGGKNIATFCLTNNVTVTRASIPPGEKGVSPLHSEAAAWSALEASGELTGITRIRWVYTERYPCGHNPGMRNCYGLLEGILKRWGEAGLQTPVYYTYEYPDDSHMFMTLVMCYVAVAQLNTRSAAEQVIIRATAPKMIDIGEYLHANHLDPDTRRADVLLIARDLYGFYRDEAIVQLKHHDL